MTLARWGGGRWANAWRFGQPLIFCGGEFIRDGLRSSPNEPLGSPADCLANEFAPTRKSRGGPASIQKQIRYQRAAVRVVAILLELGLALFA
ncbi:hypothetical protein D9M69_713370 [compost metagenome]